ncbi:unnamed protein product [Caenorhabditis angaria]|uniref:Ion transport domain-containing protein n=1 Tax=Caenorhabditis angaria TaxID=860376 RepID=A0A9P1IUE1_9PELO|nr:unnamed protein product [Caenorhabditis angaria]
MIYNQLANLKFFGEIDDEEKTGISKDCEGYKNYTTFDKMDYQQASCFLRAIFIPYLFFFYMFFSGILLINLLTAQLTKEYDEICENSKYYMDYDLNKTVKNAAEKYDITLENLEKIQDELENVIKMYSDKLRPQTRIGHRQTLDYQGDQSPMPIVDSIERLSSSNVMEAPRFVAGSTIEDNNFRRPSVMNFESQNKPKFSVGSTVENDDSRSPSVQIPVESETSESHGLLQNDESNVQTWFSGCTIS